MAKYDHYRLRKNNKLMLRVDNQENNDIDAITVFKPSNSKACNPVKLYEETEKEEKENNKINKIGLVAVVTIVITALGVYIYMML